MYLAISLIFLLVAARISLSNCVTTYGELAKEVASKYLDSLDTQLPILTDQSVPTNVKPLRKAILYLRDSLDIFVFAYPDDGKGDTWRDIRKLLDEGYTNIGNFQDLQYSDHTPEEEKKLLDLCLDWKNVWIDASDSEGYEEYIRDPKKEKLTDRKNSDLFGNYWKNVDVEPKSDLNGVKNVARLTHHLIQFSRDNLKFVLGIKDVIDLVNHDEFHDFRKVLRSIEFLSVFLLPERTIYTSDVSALLEVNDNVYDGFGDINNEITNYYHEEKNGAGPDKLAALKAKIESDWDAIKKYIADTDLDQNLDDLKDFLIDY